MVLEVLLVSKEYLAAVLVDASYSHHCALLGFGDIFDLRGMMITIKVKKMARLLAGVPRVDLEVRAHSERVKGLSFMP